MRRISRTKLVSVIGLMAVAALGMGCSNSMKEQNAHLTEENKGLRAQLADRNDSLEQTRYDLDQRNGEIAGLQRDMDARWQPTPAAADGDPFSEIEGVTGSVAAGEVTATVQSDVLFDAGKSTLKTGAKSSLEAVAVILKNSYSGKSIRVTGHTDKDPIRKSGFKSNYHLGFERAYAVREFLVSRGVPKNRVYIASFGPNEALGSKKDSRRVEIAVVLN